MCELNFKFWTKIKLMQYWYILVAHFLSYYYWTFQEILFVNSLVSRYNSNLFRYLLHFSFSWRFWLYFVSISRKYGSDIKQSWFSSTWFISQSKIGCVVLLENFYFTIILVANLWLVLQLVKPLVDNLSLDISCLVISKA